VIGGSAGNPAVVTILASGIGSTTSPAASLASNTTNNDAFISYVSAGDFSVPFDMSTSSPSGAIFDLSNGPNSMLPSGSALVSAVPEPSAGALAALVVVSVLLASTATRVYRRRRRSGFHLWV